MKRKKDFIIVVLSMLCIILCAFLIKNNTEVESSSKENHSTSSSEQYSSEADGISDALKKYKAFLQDEISSENEEDKESYYLRDYCNCVVPGKTKAGIRYALFDMTGDELPELHVLTDISYAIHTIENNQLMEWYHGDRYNRPLNNGMIFRKGDSESSGDGWIVLDSKGAEVCWFWFGKSGNDYRFSTSTGDEDIKLSKNQWEKMKKTFLPIDSDKIVWKDIDELDF